MAPLSVPQQRLRLCVYLLNGAALGPAWYVYLKLVGVIAPPEGEFGWGPIKSGGAAFWGLVLASCITGGALRRLMSYGPLGGMIAGMLMPIVGGGAFGAIYGLYDGIRSTVSAPLGNAFLFGLLGSTYPLATLSAFVAGFCAAVVLYPIARWSNGQPLWTGH